MIALPLLLAVTLTTTAPPAITMAHVVQSAVTYHPAASIAAHRVDAARGQRTRAQGAFDTRLTATAGAAPIGPYDYLGGSIGVAQRTTLWGASVAGGYRYGAGFPGYKGDQVTPVGGELFVGLVVPLLQDRTIDSARYGVARGRALVHIAKDRGQEVRRRLAYAAARAWVYWRASEARLGVAERQVVLAKARLVALQKRVSHGSAAALVLVEGQRSLIARQAKVTRARQKRDQAALALSFYLRDPKGRPIRPPANRQPQLVAPGTASSRTASPSQVAGLIRDLASRRPDLRAARRAVGLIRLKLRLLDQRLLPKLKLKIEATRGIGAAVDWLPGQPAYAKPSVIAKLAFSLPLQRRKAAGKRATSRAKLRVAEAKLALAVDKIRLSVGKAAIAWRAAERLHGQRADALGLARTLAAAERRKWQLGRSDLFRVLARERGVAKAALAEIEGRAAWHRARVDTLARAARLRSPRAGISASVSPATP